MFSKAVLKRDEIAEADKWKLEDMYPSDSAWEEEYETLLKEGEKLASYNGRLSESADILLEYLSLEDEVEVMLERVYVYANERYHQDTTVSKYQAYSAKADHANSIICGAGSFLAPEIIAMDESVIEEFYKACPELTFYKRKLDEILRGKKHTLSDKEEALLAKAGEVLAAPSNIFSMFNNADIKFASIRDLEGNRIPITTGNFVLLQRDPDRSMRKEAFEELYHEYNKWGNTIATTYLSKVKSDLFYADVRKFDSPRAMYLDNGNIPENVYDNLIDAVHDYLPAMYKYVGLRKKLLMLDKLHMYDVYVPLVDKVNHRYTFEEAKEIVINALAPMGEEYVSILKEGFENRWIDVYQNENKRAGAYSWGAYGTHPYVLLNFQGDLDSVFTLAHEMGHAIHTYLSNSNQKSTYASYLIFVAEVASTCNENLLMQYLLKNSTDKKERLYLINHYLEEFRGTVFRQTMFAEFEQIVHQKMAEGQALTRDELNSIYHELVSLYFGEDMVIDEEIDCEWMRIPHFYSPFYVYQYATGFSAATAFSKKILSLGKDAVDAYIGNFLTKGCSKDPIDLLKDAGVDMSTKKPVTDALEVFSEYLDMFEKEALGE